jgi:hypothetical protein
VPAIGSRKRPSGPSKRRRGEAAAGWADGPEDREEEENVFFFFFQIFQEIPKWILNFSFVFLNRAHNTKYYATA